MKSGAEEPYCAVAERADVRGLEISCDQPFLHLCCLPHEQTIFLPLAYAVDFRFALSVGRADAGSITAENRVWHA